MKIQRFEEIVAWKKARELVKENYRIMNASDGFRKDFGLGDQIRRAAVSSMSNIAEGFGRCGDREFANFPNVASGPVAEVQSQLYVAFNLAYIDGNVFNALCAIAEETNKLLSGFMKYLKSGREQNSIGSP